MERGGGEREKEGRKSKIGNLIKIGSRSERHPH